MTSPYLAHGLPAAHPTADGIDTAYWNGLRQERLILQRCQHCDSWQWGPEWICHVCRSFDMGWQETNPEGVIYSWTRTWHPAREALRDQGPYIIALVTLPQAGSVRLIGNLLGDPLQEVAIGSSVCGIFEHHDGYTLLHWQRSRL